MRLFLIRHAQSQNNALPERQRVKDPAITDLGHRQAELLGRRSKTMGLTRLITSPFLRTLQTTEYIRRATGLAPEVRSALHELGGCVSGYEPRYVGEPGMSRVEIQEQFPDYRIADEIDETGWWKQRSRESLQQAEQRAEQLLAETIEEFAGTDERVAYVMHADIKRILISQFHEDPLEMPCNTSVTTVRINGQHTEMQDYNCYEHLSEELVSY